MNPLTVETPLWVFLIAAGFAIAVYWVGAWFKDHYQLAGHHAVRRWYCTGARVWQHGTPGSGPKRRMRVLSWSDDDTEVPWLLVSPLGDDGAAAFWAALTEFSPGGQS